MPTATLTSRSTEPLSAPVLPALRIGPHVIGTPVVLAPMAGITNRAFRRLCRHYGDAGAASGVSDATAAAASGASEATGVAASGASSLYVSEMITSRALVERVPLTMRLIEHDPDESPRSIQLYSVDPATTAKAVHLLASEGRCDHIDLNFGCPVPKVTRKGGGSALPWKTELFRGVVANAVREAAPYGIPVTVKMRKGIDDDHLTYLEAGRIAEGEGAAAVALHARTAAQAYSGHADWSAIARLKQTVTSVPVLGNGDIWSADDALQMVAETGCDGVVVGRGCLGRPWLFADLAAAFSGSAYRVSPTLREVTDTLRRHAEYLCEFYESEHKGCRDIRKHIAWYLKGFRVGSQLRSSLGLVTSLAALDELIGSLDLDQPWPGEAADGPRGRAGSERRVILPDGWLASRELDDAQRAEVAAAEVENSGG
ncbi:tRNA dihydrouridine synthase DusB [Calidifontibacter sp. DB0510]|uniref:tRNA dihydrouridine synthase DusB n=1 Tax=Metallococcus carri TaxID=1656884 RepID=A0A967B538_9MICO|nr:tRNA dihydrouridine synthase DusB [Metallococcus carri]NHN57430.1 tRNA dihydrouridine synthase DusB [Metallococcus carri]NOP39174.1 tRNA dihydrouridine synthase DusB [Calidifontibacter sp. DB2511S]